MQRSSSKPSLLMHQEQTVPGLGGKGGKGVKGGKEGLTQKGRRGSSNKMATLYL